MHSFLRAYPTEAKLLAVLLVICAGAVAGLARLPDAGEFHQPSQQQRRQRDLGGGASGGADRGGDRHFLRGGGIAWCNTFASMPLPASAAATGPSVSCSRAVSGMVLGLINAFLIHQFRIISIVVTISTFNAFFGLLMFFSSGRFLYNLPAWWSHRVILWEYQTASGTWAELILPVAVMAVRHGWRPGC